MRLFQPGENAIVQGRSERSQFIDLGIAGDSGRFINTAAPFRSECLQWIDDRAVIANSQLERLDCMVVRAASMVAPMLVGLVQSSK